MRVLFEDYPWPAHSNITPYAHQIMTTKTLLTNPRAFVLNEMGTGKTLSALWAADYLLMNGKIDKVLIVGTLSTLNAVWTKEIYLNFPHRKYAVAHGSIERKLKALNSDSDFIVINHDGVSNLRNQIIEQRFKLIIIDELTAYKNSTSRRSKAMRAIADASTGVWGMTGNPIANSVLDAFGQCVIVNKDNPYLPKHKTQFKLMTMQQVATWRWVPKPDAEKIVYRIMQPSIRFQQEDCVDLPDINYMTYNVDLSSEQKNSYDIFVEEMVLEFNSGMCVTAKTAAVKLIKLLQIVSGSLKSDDGGIVHYDITPRFDFTVEIFNQTPQRKLIVVCLFRATADRLNGLFGAAGIESAVIHGGVGESSRRKIFSEFATRLEILVVQVATVAHGITLTSASTILFWDLTPNYEHYTQVCARIRRISQTRKQQVIHMVSSKADARILSILKQKQEFSTVALGVFRDVIEG